MKRFLAILAIVGLVVLTTTPAKAAPAPSCAPIINLSVAGQPLELCLVATPGEPISAYINLAGATFEPLELVPPITFPETSLPEIIERIVEVPVLGEAPAPATVTVTAPPPAPRTVTRAPATATRTVTEESTTVTETSPAPSSSATPTSENGPVGQDQDESDRLDNDSSTPTLATPPEDRNASDEPIFDFIPDDPEEAAAAFSILGLLAGIALGMGALYFIYKSGRDKGEEEFAESFIAPQGPKHRA